MSESVLALIPARGGSKGLPRKNLSILAGKPLIAWTIEAAKSCPLVTRTVVSTDDEEIARIAKQFGAEVPFLRSPELSGDSVTSEEVLLHALNWIEEKENKRYDILLYLQPTDPFRRNNIIFDVIKSLIEHPEIETVFAARPDHKNYWAMRGGTYVRLDERGHAPRQIKAHIYREDTGIACATRISVIKKGRRIGDRVLIVPHSSPGDFIDIHTELDLWLANQLATERNELPNQPS